jgi:hypothetical protein
MSVDDLDGHVLLRVTERVTHQRVHGVLLLAHPGFIVGPGPAILAARGGTASSDPAFSLSEAARQPGLVDRAA